MAKKPASKNDAGTSSDSGKNENALGFVNTRQTKSGDKMLALNVKRLDLMQVLENTPADDQGFCFLPAFRRGQKGNRFFKIVAAKKQA